ncbi:MAG: 50S ribosomal protein L9 [Treponema sp.]|uniref:50S ribosomal protein L9 n=1 Tax=Treponema sp. TaxID=166 RepID=UPI00298DB171|nr:50S ribosomal protein L9 [Treponema sp.]MBR5934442.1 50S ribosomal protein L9 [Treponema sp.]
MKVILNADVKHLGEEGDVKVVANGYYRNFLFPRNLAVPYNEATVAYFESRKAEIEAKKDAKRAASASLKEKLESIQLEIAVPAGSNGKLYGAVTSQTVMELLAKQGFEIERKKIEIPGLAIKSCGNYKVTIKLYEAQTAEVHLTVKAQEEKAAEKKADKKAEKKSEAKAEPKAEAEEKTEA